MELDLDDEDFEEGREKDSFLFDIVFCANQRQRKRR